MSGEIPQLRLRSEFSFRDGRGANAFGTLDRIAARLSAIGAPGGGLVDGSTWGHTRWAAAAKTAGLAPFFGFSIPIPQPDGRRPTAWALATADSRPLYQLSTRVREDKVDRAEEFRRAAGKVLRFAGAALTDPETFDFVDVNPSSPLTVRAALRLAERTGKPLVLTSDNAYPALEDRATFLAIGGREAITPKHILAIEGLWTALGPLIGRDAFDAAVQGTFAAAVQAGSVLTIAPLISVSGDFRAAVAAGKAERIAAGRIEWTEEYEARMQREIEMVEAKAFQSYFLVVADLVRWAKQRMLVGPARGSSAGSLLCYLLRITEVDPLKHNLLFERFIDVTRADLPDIDIDFSHTKRDAIFDYLAQRCGREHVARLGNISTLKPRSAIAEVGKRLGIPPSDTFDLANALIEYSSGDSRYGKGLEDTIAGTAAGQAFIAKHPNAAVMTVVENHAWHVGVHAAGVVVCNEPVSNFATVGQDGVAHVDKYAAEALGLLKIDALGLRTLGVIEDAKVVDAETLYGLPLNDPEVFRIFNEKKFAGIFQFEGSAQRRVSAQVNIDSFRKIDHVTALARPGPLGGGAANTYIDRAAGREEVAYRHPSMEAYLNATMGVILYQEQVMRIGAELGRMTWQEVTLMRKAMSGRKGKEFFDKLMASFMTGAAAGGIDAASAESIWQEINSFGAWGMNASHTVSYGIVSYWCAWMKRYYPLEYAAACLRNAKDDDQAEEILRELVAEGVAYTPFDVDRSEESWSAKDGALLGGFQNVRGIGAIMAAKYVAARAANDPKWPAMREKVLKMPVQLTDLRPAHTMWGHLYADPAAANVDGRIYEIGELNDQPEHVRDNCVVLGRVEKKDRKDRNEAVQIKKRGGEIFKGQSLFIDVHIKDDSVGKPVVARCNEKDWFKFGEKIADRAVEGQDWLLIRGRWLERFNMMLVKRVRCLNRPEILQ